MALGEINYYSNIILNFKLYIFYYVFLISLYSFVKQLFYPITFLLFNSYSKIIYYNVTATKRRR